MIVINILRSLSYTATITVTSSSVTPTYIFLYRRDLDNVDIYTNVCTVSDINDFPVLSPGVGIPFFRSDVVEKTFDNIPEMEVWIESVKADINQLDVDYILYTTEAKIGVVETVVINEV